MATIPHCGHAGHRGASAQGRIPFVLEADLQGQEARRATTDIEGSSGIDTFSRFEVLLAQAASQQSNDAATSRRRLEQIEREIRNCTQAIATLGLSPFLGVQLIELEAEHREHTERLASLKPRTLRLRLQDTRGFVETRVANLQSLLNGEPRIARAEIAKYVEKITLTPAGRAYVVSGTWDLLGGVAVAVTMVPGDRHAPFCHKLTSLSTWPPKLLQALIARVPAS